MLDKTSRYGIILSISAAGTVSPNTDLDPNFVGQYYWACVSRTALSGILVSTPKILGAFSLAKKTTIAHEIILNGSRVEWANEWPYLGVTLKSGESFNCSVSDRLRKFYRCANAILRIDGRSNDTVMLRLIETHCFPILSYAIEIVHVADRDERRQLRVAYNSVFRKIFGYRWSQSVSNLQSFLSRPTWEQLVERRTESFIARLLNNGRESLSSFLFTSCNHWTIYYHRLTELDSNLYHLTCATLHVWL